MFRGDMLDNAENEKNIEYNKAKVKSYVKYKKSGRG